MPLGHLVPGIRTLISIPAGVFGMGLVRFVALTLLGASAWTTLLGLAGYALGSRYEQVERYIGPASTAILAAILLWYLHRVATFADATKGADSGHPLSASPRGLTSNRAVLNAFLEI